MLNTFTSGRDYRPRAAFPTALPLTAVYARVIVAGGTFDDASDALDAYHLGRYTETLRGPNDPDGPAEAVAEYVKDQGISTATVFVVYRIDTTMEGHPLNPPRLMVAQLRGSVATVIGRVRTVGTKLASDRAFRILLDDDQPDEMPVADTEHEGPTDDVPLVEGPAAFPDNAAGYLAKGREKRLLRALPDVQAELGRVIAGIDRNRRSTDPRVSYGRNSERLLDLSHQLAAAAADAAAVEIVLQGGN